MNHWLVVVTQIKMVDQKVLLTVTRSDSLALRLVPTSLVHLANCRVLRGNGW